MSYRDRQHAGSFRGVPFRTPSSEREGGRRGVLHEYPGRDDYTTQDLGQAPTRFHVTAVIYGADYDVTRDALIRALEQGGPGKLVHRYFGELEAELEPGQKYKLTETEEQGGKAVFTIPFVRSGKSKSPSAQTDSAQFVTTTAEVARTYARAKFEGDVSQFGPEWLRDQFLDAVNGANSTMLAINRKAQGALAYTSGVQATINGFGNSAATLIASPTLVFTIADEIIAINGEMFESIATIGQAHKDTVDAFRGVPSLFSAQAQEEARKVVRTLRGAVLDLMSSQDYALDETTPTTTQSTKNQRATVEVMRVSGVVAASEAALSLPYDSQSTAEGLRDTLADALLELAVASTDDDLYAGLIDLRVALIQHLTLALGALPQPAQFTPPSTLPALLIAHAVHNDARRCDEIVARNNIRHPGFVAMGVPIEIVE